MTRDNGAEVGEGRVAASLVGVGDRSLGEAVPVYCSRREITPRVDTK